MTGHGSAVVEAEPVDAVQADGLAARVLEHHAADAQCASIGERHGRRAVPGGLKGPSLCRAPKRGQGLTTYLL